MRSRPPDRRFFETYTHGLTGEEFQRLFTRDARDAYRFFARDVDRAALAALPWHRRAVGHLRLLFLAFTLKLPPARRALYGIALVSMLIGALELFRGIGTTRLPVVGLVFPVYVPAPIFQDGTGWLILGFVLLNLLVLLELADRLTLKNDLEVAREIQQAMLPAGTYAAPGVEASGRSRPANTVGGDFYDILPLPDGRLVVALGDVAGKGSPAALLMALLLAMLRTLIDEGLQPAGLVERLNVQIGRHAPPSRFITLFLGVFEPATGRLTYVNAGHMPPLLLRRDGSMLPLEGGGVALGMFDGSRYAASVDVLHPGDALLVYSDGVTEAEDPSGRPFEEAGLRQAIAAATAQDAQALAAAVFAGVERHAGEARFADDLTVLILRRPV